MVTYADTKNVVSEDGKYSIGFEVGDNSNIIFHVHNADGKYRVDFEVEDNGDITFQKYDADVFRFSLVVEKADIGDLSEEAILSRLAYTLSCCFSEYDFDDYTLNELTELFDSITKRLGTLMELKIILDDKGKVCMSWYSGRCEEMYVLVDIHGMMLSVYLGCSHLRDKKVSELNIADILYDKDVEIFLASGDYRSGTVEFSYIGGKYRISTEIVHRLFEPEYLKSMNFVETGKLFNISREDKVLYTKKVFVDVGKEIPETSVTEDGTLVLL